MFKSIYFLYIVFDVLNNNLFVRNKIKNLYKLLKIKNKLFFINLNILIDAILLVQRIQKPILKLLFVSKLK